MTLATAPETTQVPAASVPASSRRAGRGTAWIAAAGLAPFGVYLAIFLILPTVIAIGTGLFDGDGNLTIDNLAGLVDPTVLRTFGNTIWLSALTAIIGAVIGSIACYALLGLPEDGRVRQAVDAASSVLAQFGGVMLAFAFIATVGMNGGFLTRVLLDVFGIDIYPGENWLHALPGLVPVYVYFQVPLMIITFMPAMARLKSAWVEANLALGGTRGDFWRHVGIPVLTPPFLASLLLLFANAFSSYATAAALASQGAQIVPLQIRAALTSETVLGRENLAGALALGMIVIVAVTMWLYALVQRRAERWQQ